MFIKAIKRASEVLDQYNSVAEALKALGLWGPVTALLAAVGASIWARTSGLPPVVVAVIGLAVGLLVYAISICYAVHKQVRPNASWKELARPHIQGYTLRISDLAQDELIIRGKTLEDCTIYGPAVLVLLGGAGMLHECAMVASSAEAMFFHVGQGFKEKTGVIGLDNCVLRRCRLVKIGFAGDEALLEALRRQQVKP